MPPRSLPSLDKGVLILFILFLLAFPLLFKPWVHGTDPMGYYSWLRSAVIDGDLDTADEYAHFGQANVGSTTKTGYRDNPYAIGSAILWSPFFLMAHGLTLAGQGFGLRLVADGYGQPYILAVSLGSALYALMGLWLVYRLAQELFAPPVAMLAVIAVWLASPLVFYMYSHPIMSHANDAFAYALFLLTWRRTRAQRSAIQYGLLGLTAGLCALVRTQNAILVVFPLLEIVLSFAQTGQRDSWRRAVREGLLRGIIFSAAWWLAFLPQLIVWRIVFGAWLPGNPYTLSGGGAFDFLHPHLLDVLFSTNHGLFVWTPLILPAVLGWSLLWRKDRRLTALVAFNFVLQLYVVASWSAWDGSAAFGQRLFTNLAPAFSLGLAAVLTTLHRRFALSRLIVLCVFFVVWNGLLIARYALEDIPRTGPVPLDQLVIGQFTVIPRYWSRIAQILITHR